MIWASVGLLLVMFFVYHAYPTIDGKSLAG